jgi:hypothetical protein
VQNLQEQLAAERATNQANTNALVAHMMQLQQAFTVRKHNGKHPFGYTNTYVLIKTLQLQAFAQQQGQTIDLPTFQPPPPPNQPQWSPWPSQVS